MAIGANINSNATQNNSNRSGIGGSVTGSEILIERGGMDWPTLLTYVSLILLAGYLWWRFRNGFRSKR